MKSLSFRSSFQKKLMGAFLTVGILPLLVCVLLILNLFRLSLTGSAASVAENQLSAMTGSFEELLTEIGRAHV